MKRLSILAVTGVMSFMLSACGEDSPKMPEAKSDDMMQTQQMQQPMQAPNDTQAGGQNMEQPAAQPSQDQMDGATTQE